MTRGAEPSWQAGFSFGLSPGCTDSGWACRYRRSDSLDGFERKEKSR